MPKKPTKKAVKKSNPSLPAGVPWKDPFPEAVLNEDGTDKVMVRAVPKQDLIINGTKLHSGIETVLPCSVAHAHAAALAAPPEE